jgi:hypothetical protein
MGLTFPEELALEERAFWSWGQVSMDHVEAYGTYFGFALCGAVRVHTGMDGDVLHACSMGQLAEGGRHAWESDEVGRSALLGRHCEQGMAKRADCGGVLYSGHSKGRLNLADLAILPLDTVTWLRSNRPSVC